MGPPLGAQPVFESLNRAAGLPSDYVNAIYQDRFGFLWFGTDAGLARYDGQRVETFTADDGLPHPFVYAAREDGEGTLWVGTFAGLARFDGTRFLPEREPFGETLIPGLRVDDEGRLIVRSERGVARREGTSWRVVRQAAGGASLAWRSVVPLSDGRLLAGGTDGAGRGALFLLTPSAASFRVTPLYPDGVTGAVLGVAEGGDGTVWVFGSGDGSSVRRVRLEGRQLVGLDSAQAGHVRLLVADAHGGASVYRGGPASGVLHLAPGRAALDPVHPGPAQTLAYDYEGSLWIGTFGEGAYRLRGDHLTQVTTAPAARITRGPDGTIWATGDATWRIDPATLDAAPVAARGPLREVAFDGAGRPLFSSGAVLYRSDRAGALREVAEEPGWISGIDALADTLRFSSYSGGVVRMVRGVARDTLQPGQGLPTRMVEGLRRTEGALWAVTRSHGAFRIDGARTQPVGRREGLPSSAVFSVYQATDGATWFGTDRGIARLAPGDRRAVAFGEDVLRGQRVTALFEDQETVWVVGDRALYALIDGRVRSMGAVPIVPVPEASINAAVFAPDQRRLFFATTEGVVALDLDALPKRPAPPPRIAIRSVQVGDETVPIQGTPVASHLAPIGPGRYRVEVEFAPLSYLGDVRAEVRLGDGPWSDVGAERRVVFPDLGRGAYRIEVRAVAATGEASQTPAVLTFTIAPRVWQRPVVQILGALLGLALLALGVRHASQRRLRARVRALEVERRLHDERERISRDLHDHVGAQLSTLLAGVELARLERRAAGDGAPPDRRPDAPDPLDGLEADARTTMRQLRETIWALHGAHVTMPEFASRVRADLAARRSAVASAVLCEGCEGRVLSPVQALNLFRIVQEAVTNALKYARARRIDVTLRHSGEHVTVEVCDDGTFRDPPGGDGLSGFGIRSMRARADQLGGELVLDASRGTTIRVTVPAEPVHAA